MIYILRVKEPFCFAEGTQKSTKTCLFGKADLPGGFDKFNLSGGAGNAEILKRLRAKKEVKKYEKRKEIFKSNAGDDNCFDHGY